MVIWKWAVAFGLSAFLVGGGAVFAQGAVEEEAADGEVMEDVAEEEAPAPKPVAAPAPAAAPAAVKAEPKVDLYGAAQYRFRYRMHSLADTAGKSGSTNDYQNLFSWRAGMKAKVNDQLSLQFQIGNDWGAGEAVNWANNNTPGDRVGFQNLYVHIASFKWNPGVIFIEGGVIALSSNGTLDLLERSLNIGSYGEAGFQGWSTEVNSSMLGIKLGVPIVKGDVKVGAELFQSVIDQRAQSLAASENIPGRPSSPMFVFTLPVEAGAFKLTPEVTMILNRNWNYGTEKGDDEVLAGLSAGYKVNADVALSLTGGFGSVSNENSKAGAYGAKGNREVNIVKDIADTLPFYKSEGMLLGAGANIKAGPGTIQFDFKYNSAVNAATEETEDRTKYDYMYTDIRYAYKASDKFTITPRYRNYYRTFPPKHVNESRMENRLELILEGSF